ncbi:MAG: isovaleryl-CoA dehydrogenase [Ktedonobacteraceae bacterium]|nr:isovaleryl-CoA dehydrogenase [Ktedonobacteraceae bacterium]
MDTLKQYEQHGTHAIVNQPPPLVDYNLFTQDRALLEAVRREGAGQAEKQLAELGMLLGGPEAIQWGFDANEFPPVLHTHDRYGHRIDEVTFHPAWHHLMNTAVNVGVHASSWREGGTHVARAAAFYMLTQVEAGHCCPISMTHAAIPVLRRHPRLAREWLPGLQSLTYDPTIRPAAEKRGLLCGMGMTEKQGGSDVRANATRAFPLSSSEKTYLLTGHKWFCSAPMCDVFLVLAQAPAGLSCFLLPRVLPDGTRNHFFIQRLKHKLGNRSNASSEVEFDDTLALLVGEEGQGVRTIIEMVNYTRLDCALGSAALMRQSLTQAIHHAAHRQTFGKRLIDQLLMRNVLADLALEAEAALVLSMRLARACDQAESDEHEGHIKRLGTAIAKYWISKRCPLFTGEALECLGGNGYVEECIMPRLYREAPLNSIWEGSGNVNCLDVLRALAKEPQTLASFFAEVQAASKAETHLAGAVARLQHEFADLSDIEWRARSIVEQMALVFQAALLVQHAPSAVANAFCASRLTGEGGRAPGTLPRGIDAGAIIQRASLL